MGLKGYILRRTIDSIVTMFFIFLINFFIFFIRMEEYRTMTQTQQFIEYLKFVFIDRFGQVPGSGFSSTIDYVFSALPATISLLVSSILLVLLVSLFFGAIASYKFGKFPDLSITAILIFIAMIPAWWLGFMISRIGPELLGLDAFNPMFEFVKYGVLPSLVVSLCLCGVFFLIVRNSMVNIFPQNFVMLAKAKGVGLKSLLFKHVMRNALLAITAMFAMAPFLVVNQLVPIERVFRVGG